MPSHRSPSWRQELEQTGQALTAALYGFDQTLDHDLLDYYLFESSALRARYSYLLRQIKRTRQEDQP